MNRLISKLPPLKSLVAFEAVCRCGSVTAAAKELTSSQPSVSQHIRQLETNLGTALFFKQGRQLKLTTAGQSFYEQIAPTLWQIAQTAENLRDINLQQKTLDIICHTGLAMFWLLPRLTELQNAIAPIQLNITLSDNPNQPITRRANLLIMQFGPLSHHKNQRVLFHESVSLVAGSRYAQTHQLTPSTSLAQIVDGIAQQTIQLIHMDNQDGRWLDWRQWLRKQGVELPQTHQPVYLGNYHTVITQAQHNQGLALGWHGIIDTLIDQGDLVCVTTKTTQRKNYGYYLDIAHLDATFLPVVCALQQFATPHLAPTP